MSVVVRSPGRLGRLAVPGVEGEVVRRDAYPPINFGGTGIREYLLTPSGEKRVQAILSDIEPGGGSGDEPTPCPRTWSSC
jgi:hypothetical protein